MKLSCCRKLYVSLHHIGNVHIYDSHESWPRSHIKQYS